MGTLEYIEPQVRSVVAEHLGVRVEELDSAILLREDLAADSLDVVELAMALEAEFAIVMSERILDEVRTYGDLVQATTVLVRARGEAEKRGAEPPRRIVARIVPPASQSSGTLERTGWLTPYIVETIVEDAVHAGPGAWVEVTIATSTTDDLVQVERQMAALAKHGVLVCVRRDGRHVAPRLPFTTGRGTEPEQGRLAEGHAPLSDPLLDHLTGAETTVTVTGYAGDDPWEADDLMVRAGQDAKRFGDGTPAEKAQALSGNGPCHFVDGDSGDGGFRVTTSGHHTHAHVDRRFERDVGPMRNLIEDEQMRLEIRLGFAGNVRYYQSGRCTALGPKGELLISREAAYYAQDPEERAFEIASSTTPPAPTEFPAGRPRGIRAHFDMSSPSPNGFRPVNATLSCARDDGGLALIIKVSARVAGKDVLGRVTLCGGARPTLDVRYLPSAP